ncbi:MAG: tRNA (guanine(46)-N(7))-methyltransferase TrmB, partial [Paracoccaceae bacterium]
MEPKHPKGAPWRNFYGRIHGKGLRDAQKRYMDDLADIGLGGVDWSENPNRDPLDLNALFSGRPVWLEIGFGSGEHMIHQAKANPNVGIIGAEPYVNGVATALGKRRDSGVDNIRIHAGDARDLMDVLPAGSIEKAFLLYPDPWPKARHHRRGFVTQEHLAPLHQALK